MTDETKDDLGLQLYISDCNGSANYYHMYSSPLYSMTVYALQKIFPTFAWNYLLQVIMIFISILIISNEILEHLPDTVGKFVSIFFSVLLYFNTISSLNFTRTSALVICAGICLLCKEHYVKWIGGIWFLIGMIVRHSVICIAIGFWAVVFLSALWKEKALLKVRIKNVLLRYGLPMFCLLGMSAGICSLEKVIINSNEEWKHLFEKNTLSAGVLDYELRSYDEASEEYQKYGISENDCKMIEKRMSNGDDSYFTIDLYKIFISRFSEKWKFEISFYTLQMWIRELGRYLSSSCFGWIVLGSLLSTFFITDRKNKEIIFLIGICIACYLLLFCLLGRVVNRVSFGVYLCGFVTLLLCCSFPIPKFSILKKRYGSILNICAIVFLLMFVGSMSIKYQRQTDEMIAELYDYMEQDKEHFFFYNGFSEYRCVENLLLMKDYWNTKNSFYSSDFDVSPNEKEKFLSYGIENIYKDSVDSNTIRFINCSDMDIIIRYIQEHYCETAKALVVDEIGEYKVYQVVAQ